jgi:hypothetical protein
MRLHSRETLIARGGSVGRQLLLNRLELEEGREHVLCARCGAVHVAG